jgi:hypothetical protein
VREDAHTIVTQALRMREIIENLVRPEVPGNESGAPIVSDVSGVVAPETA